MHNNTVQFNSNKKATNQISAATMHAGEMLCSAKQTWVCYKCIYMCCLFDGVREALYLTDQGVKNTFDWYLLACV